MTAADRLDEIQKRAEAATDGPWASTYGEREHARVWGPDEDDAEPLLMILGFKDTADGSPDAEFIAHARTDVPALVAALRAVLTECDKAEAIGVQGAYDHGCRDQARWIRRAVEAALGAES